MLLTRLFQIIFTLILISGCANQPTPSTKPTTDPKYFSASQASSLRFCLSISDTVRAIAEMKNNGKTQENASSYYKARSIDQRMADLTDSLVHKVYSEDSREIWDYTIAAMGECATEVANASNPDQVQVAKFCMQNQLAAQVAQAHRESGKNIDETFAHFLKMRSGMGKKSLTYLDDAINTGFHWKGERAGLFDRIGNPCINRFATLP